MLTGMSWWEHDLYKRSFCPSLMIWISTPGATKSVYAPEPFDVGRILQAEITYNGQQITLTTTGAVDPGVILVDLVFNLVSFLNLLLVYEVFIFYQLSYVIIYASTDLMFIKQLLDWEAMWRHLFGSMMLNFMYVLPHTPPSIFKTLPICS